MDLKELAENHFDIMQEIQKLQEEKVEVDEKIVKKIVETNQLDFVTVNWTRLHNLVYGHPGKKG